MRSHFIVLTPPIFNLLDGVVQVHEPVPAKTFEPGGGVEGFDEGAEVILSAYGGLDLTPDPSVVAERVFRAMSRLASAKL